MKERLGCKVCATTGWETSNIEFKKISNNLLERTSVRHRGSQTFCSSEKVQPSDRRGKFTNRILRKMK